MDKFKDNTELQPILLSSQWRTQTAWEHPYQHHPRDEARPGVQLFDKQKVEQEPGPVIVFGMFWW